MLKQVMPSEPEVLPGFPQTPDQPASLYAPATPAFTCDTPQGPYFDCDPRTDPPVLPQPGWFADVELGVMLPHIMNDTHEAVTVNGVTSRVQLPGGTLDWAAAPRFELGYRLPEGFGEIALAYRFLGSQGHSTVSGAFDAPDAIGSVLTRLDIQTADLDYASNELSICSWWAKWRIGLRGADVYFDSQVDESLAAAEAGSGVFERRMTNNFWGIGPHGSLELERRLTDWGLLVLGRVDGSILLGRVDQAFFETSTTKVGGQFLTGQTLESQAMAVPQLEGNIGLGWRPPSCPALRVFAGYENEHWWNVGHVVRFRLECPGLHERRSVQGRLQLLSLPASATGGAPRPGLFWLFWALKKGDFFGLHRKKVRPLRFGVPVYRTRTRQPVNLRKSFSLAPCGRGAGGEGADGPKDVRGAEQKEGYFFGVHTKKVGPPLWRTQKVPLKSPPLPGTTLRRKVSLKNLVSQLPRASDVATN